MPESTSLQIVNLGRKMNNLLPTGLSYTSTRVGNTMRNITAESREIRSVLGTPSAVIDAQIGAKSGTSFLSKLIANIKGAKFLRIAGKAFTWLTIAFTVLDVSLSIVEWIKNTYTTVGVKASNDEMTRFLNLYAVRVVVLHCLMNEELSALMTYDLAEGRIPTSSTLTSIPDANGNAMLDVGDIIIDDISQLAESFKDGKPKLDDATANDIGMAMKNMDFNAYQMILLRAHCGRPNTTKIIANLYRNYLMFVVESRFWRAFPYHVHFQLQQVQMIIEDLWRIVSLDPYICQFTAPIAELVAQSIEEDVLEALPSPSDVEKEFLGQLAAGEIVIG